MIIGNPTWNQRVAALAAHGRPLYTFEIPDEGLILTTFEPEDVDVTLDWSNLLAQPLWARAVALNTALLTATLPPTQGYAQAGSDGAPLVAAPSASITRFVFNPAAPGCNAYLSWYGVNLPPGSLPLSRATSLTLQLVSTLTTGSLTPYAEIDYSVLGSAAFLGTSLPTGWFQALHSNAAGWTAQATSVQLWPGNTNVGATLPDLNRVLVRLDLNGATGTVAAPGITFSVSAQLVVTFA